MTAGSYKAIASICSVLILSGCAAGSVSDLRQNHSGSSHITVDENYQRVYKNLLESMYQCYGEGWAGVFAQYHIRSELYSELDEAEISYVMTNAGMQGHYLHVDIRGVDADHSEVDTFVSLSTWERQLSRVESWARGSDVDC